MGDAETESPLEDEQGGAAGAGVAKPSHVMSATNRGDVYVSGLSQSADSLMQVSDSENRHHVILSCASVLDLEILDYSYAIRSSCDLHSITRTSILNLPRGVIVCPRFTPTPTPMYGTPFRGR